MLEKPDLPDALLLDTLRCAYDLHGTRLEFLPLGADVNTAVYRVETAGGGETFFLKLRSGYFDEASVTIPQLLRRQGVPAIIAPRETTDRRLWAGLQSYKLLLYPFIEGKNGFDQALTDSQWTAFGTALAAVHAVRLPPELARRLPREGFTPHWREAVKAFQAQAEDTLYSDPSAVRLAAMMRTYRSEIDALIERAAQLSPILQQRAPEFVLCHSDIHGGNLILSPDGALTIVDWDNPILAPRERDLMFIGAGICDVWNTARENELFYRAYGIPADPELVDYYRCDRMLQDIVEFCKMLLHSTAGGKDREQALGYFAGSFSPGGVVEIALKR